MGDGLKDILIKVINWGMGNIVTMPTEITDIISRGFNDSIADTIINAIIPIAISLMVLFFLIDFTSKCINPEWVTYQNVVLYFIKAMIFKVVITSSSDVLGIIYRISVSVFTAISGTSSLATFDTSSIVSQINAIDDGIAGIFVLFAYLIAVILMTLVIIGAMIYIRIIIYGRIVELLLLKSISPIALSTLVSEGNSSIGKKFLQSYGAVCLQSSIIVLSSIVVTSLTGEILGTSSGTTTWDQLLGYCTVILCYVSVLAKSGTISRSILGL